MQRNKYWSRKSILLGIFLWGMLISPLFFISLPIYSKEIYFLVIYLPILVFVAFVWFGLKYEIRDTLLWVMIGPMCLFKVDINDIQSISRSYNPLSSPAASLKRMLVKYKGGEVLISPKNEKGFIKDLQEVNNSIHCGVTWDMESKSILTKFFYAIL